MQSTLLKIFVVLTLLTICRTITVDAQINDRHQQSDTSRWYASHYFGITASYMSNQRSVDIPQEYALKYGNEPLVSIGISYTTIGNFLFQSRYLRNQTSLEKILNTYPSSKLLENFNMTTQFGYNILETQTLNIYPFLGGRSSVFYIDDAIRLWIVSAESGLAVDYLFVGTPFRFSLQVGYSHAWNLRAPVDVTGNQAGFILRTNISLWFRNQASQWEL
jgi:hypothetical protein